MGVQRLRLNNCSRVEESLGTRLVLTSLNTLSDDDWIPDLSAFQRPDLPSSDDQKHFWKVMHSICYVLRKHILLFKVYKFYEVVSEV